MLETLKLIKLYADILRPVETYPRTRDIEEFIILPS